MSNTYVLLGVLIAAAVTALLRFLPFLILGEGRETPALLRYLGTVLPYATIGMLVVYGLKNVKLLEGSHGLPELLAVLLVVGLHLWKKNTLLSIFAGTVFYMILVQMVF